MHIYAFKLQFQGDESMMAINFVSALLDVYVAVQAFASDQDKLGWTRVLYASKIKHKTERHLDVFLIIFSR